MAKTIEQLEADLVVARSEAQVAAEAMDDYWTALGNAYAKSDHDEADATWDVYWEAEDEVKGKDTVVESIKAEIEKLRIKTMLTKYYRKKELQPLFPWTPDLPMTLVSVSDF